MTLLATYERAPTVRVTEVDGEVFVVPTQSRDIVYLNPTAAGIWRLLETPHDRGEILAVFVQAFPNATQARLASDLEDALDDMLARGVIRIAGRDSRSE